MLVSTVWSQANPMPCQEMAFARAGPRLYIQGGRFEVGGVRQGTYGQLYSLDLSKSWSTDAAPWQSHAPGEARYLINAVVTADNKSFYIVNPGPEGSFVFTRYDIALNTWSAPLTTSSSTEIRQGTRPVTDPRTGLIYLSGTSFMNVFNPTTEVLELSVIPPNLLTSRRFMGSVYSAHRKSILFYGGLAANGMVDPQATTVTEYNIDQKTWGTLATTGTPPLPRADFCMQANEDGTKVVVYGGRILDKNVTNPGWDFTNTIHVLDVPTGRWTPGPTGTTRLYMACTIVRDQLIVWGGADGGGNTSPAEPVIFDIATMKWATTYTAPAYFSNPTPTKGTGGFSEGGGGSTHTPSTEESDSKSNLGPILGGVFGSLLVVGLAGAIYFYTLRRKGATQSDVPPEHRGSGSNHRNEMQEAKPEPVATTSPSTFKSQPLEDAQPRNPQTAAALSSFSTLDRRDPQDTSALHAKQVYSTGISTSDSPQQPLGPHSFMGQNPVVTPIPTSAFGSSPPFYVSQPVYTGAGGAGAHPSNAIYIAHPVSSPDYSNTALHNTTLASSANSSPQYGYSAGNKADTSGTVPFSSTGAGQPAYYYVPVSAATPNGQVQVVPVSMGSTFVPASQGPAPVQYYNPVYVPAGQNNDGFVPPPPSSR
ncbi:hypothetical protein BGZ94_008548 [Podila epigama]|nr:hypothetical protein BGZ94_008548 [Podila epigama]